MAKNISAQGQGSASGLEETQAQQIMPSEQTNQTGNLRVSVHLGGPDFLDWLKSLPPGGKFMVEDK